MEDVALAPEGGIWYHTDVFATSWRRLGGRRVSSVKEPRLAAGRWNLVRACCDKRTAWIEVDGVRGESVPCGGWQFGPLIGGLGVAPNGRDYYPGAFGSLSVRLK